MFPGMRQNAIEYAKIFLGSPYLWGGDTPMAGFDCSGMVCEVLKSVGLLPPDEDLTADGLFKAFAKYGISEPVPAGLVFWGTGQKKTHVEFLINKNQTIGASGGGAKCLTLEDAIGMDAFVKIRPIKPNPIAYLDPFMF